MSKQHITQITDFFNQAKLPIPEGFKDEDVNIDAPRLFSDTFYLAYLSFMSRIALHNYTIILSQIARSDIRDYFSKRIIDAIDLYNKSADLRLSKGIFVRVPIVEISKKIQYVKSKGFLYDVFGEKRPLLLEEVTQIFGNIFSNIVGKAMATGFGQVTRSERLSDYCFEGSDLANKIITEFTTIFATEDIPFPSASDSFVTSSTVSPFSDKLILTQMLLLSATTVSNFSVAMAANLRADLTIVYLKYIAESMSFTQKGAQLMVENMWFEQPPTVLKHKGLAGFHKQSAK